ncbi:MAG: 50S ribosomal protein L13 [Candidatus Aminicenantes bacterium]|nr:50S ribosomal protein L13 [Candidatus Aminicenantes bacterium]MDH5714843.1 50S ribosomal protein L13 [Candidatus Aminicenantes bacterium]
MKTYFPKKKEHEVTWYLIDAQDKVLGRLSATIATILTGKNKPSYTPFLDMGNFVIVINASKVKLTGKKLKQKVYYRHSGYPGGIKETKAQELMVKAPEKMIRLAVWGMLPKNKLGKTLLKKMKVYAGSEHPHQAQKPKPLTID